MADESVEYRTIKSIQDAIRGGCKAATITLCKEFHNEGLITYDLLLSCDEKLKNNEVLAEKIAEQLQERVQHELTAFYRIQSVLERTTGVTYIAKMMEDKKLELQDEESQPSSSDKSKTTAAKSQASNAGAASCALLSTNGSNSTKGTTTPSEDEEDDSVQDKPSGSFEQTPPESKPVALNPLDTLNCSSLTNKMAKLQKDDTERLKQMKTVHDEIELSQVKKAHTKEIGQVKNECNDKIEQLRKELEEDKKLLKRQCDEKMEQAKEEIRESKRGMKEEMKEMRSDHAEEVKQLKKEMRSDHAEEVKQLKKEMRSDHAEEVKQLKKEIEELKKEIIGQMRMRSTEELFRQHVPDTPTSIVTIERREESIGHEAACNNKEIIKETKAIERTETIED